MNRNHLKTGTALITGSLSGIGLSVAKTLASKGHSIVLHGLPVDGNDRKLKAELEDRHSVDCFVDTTDLRNPEAIREFCGRITEETGGIDILVNNAGIQFIAPIQEFPDENWQDVIAVNLSAAFYMMKHLLPGMRKKKWGRIINISSIHGLVASVNKSAYVSAKHGLIGLTKAAALENAETGVTVNAICPGWVETELIKKQYMILAEKHNIDVEQAKERLITEKQPYPKFIQPEQIGGMVAFLCSEDASGITGSSLSVDGGWGAQ